MTRRITVPDDHVGLVLSAKLSDELMSLLRNIRRQAKPAINRVATITSASPEALQRDKEKVALGEVAGDVMLALLEAKEA